jgi:hypothetical protein
MLTFYLELKLLFKKLFGFWIFYFLMLSYNNIGDKGAKEVSKGI